MSSLGFKCPSVDVLSTGPHLSAGLFSTETLHLEQLQHFFYDRWFENVITVFSETEI